MAISDGHACTGRRGREPGIITAGRQQHPGKQASKQRTSREPNNQLCPRPSQGGVDGREGGQRPPAGCRDEALARRSSQLANQEAQQDLADSLSRSLSSLASCGLQHYLLISLIRFFFLQSHANFTHTDHEFQSNMKNMQSSISRLMLVQIYYVNFITRFRHS